MVFCRSGGSREKGRTAIAPRFGTPASTAEGSPSLRLYYTRTPATNHNNTVQP